MTPSKLGLQVAEERGPDQTISRLPTARTAFVGRTLRGPVNRPVLIKSFSEFQHGFGGLWQPSLLGYAIEQYFDNGGREALIVRVVNGASSATLTLTAGAHVLQLQALRPGTREFLRASVDFDNIGGDEVSIFNLTVQRVRAQGTGQIEDQEIFHRLSVLSSDERYLPQALAGLRNWNFPDENALMYFPRVLAHDKLRGHFESFAPCGAVAGMLARSDEMSPVWLASEREEPILRPGFRPACLVGEDRRIRLARCGVNTLQAIRSTARIGVRPRTLAAGNAANADWRYLSSRRLALFILSSIEQGTRWVSAARSPAQIAATLIAQVRAFFQELYTAGTFGTRPIDEAFFVICDERVNSSWLLGNGEIQFLIGFAASREHELHCFRISHSALGSKVQTVSLNRLNFSQYSPAEIEWVDSIASQLQS